MVSCSAFGEGRGTLSSGARGLSDQFSTWGLSECYSSSLNHEQGGGRSSYALEATVTSCVRPRRRGRADM